MSTRYSVFITPRTDYFTYGTEIDISDRVTFDGIGAIKRGIDSTDYDIGIFRYDDISIKCVNDNGYFNEETDPRSIFRFSRDLAKVRVVFTNEDGTVITFRGLLNEEASRTETVSDTVTLKILSLDSVIRNTKVAGGVITAGMTCKAALEAILNVPAITSTLVFNASNINPVYNFVIDDGTKLQNKNTRDVLNTLLLASNSIMTIDDSQNMIVRSRDYNPVTVLNLYGPHDIHRRDNIINLTAYNTGKQRMFTAVRVNDTERTNAAYQLQYGYKQKKIALDYITSAQTEAEIAQRLAEEFKAPKVEVNVKVSTKIAKDVKLLDPVSLNYPLRIRPIKNKFLPVIGITKIGDAMAPLPYTFGSLQVSKNIAFKVIEINENPKDFTTILKLRQIGTSISDGVFNVEDSSIIGFAVIGKAKIKPGATDPWNPSVVGAAKIGFTRVST